MQVKLSQGRQTSAALLRQALLLLSIKILPKAIAINKGDIASITQQMESLPLQLTRMMDLTAG